MAMRRKDHLSVQEDSTTPAIGSSDGSEQRRKHNDFFGDNPPIRVEITYRNGDKDTFKGNQIDGDNPVLKALGNIRTVGRFWRLKNKPKNGDIVYANDYQILQPAACYPFNYKGHDPAEAAAMLGCVAEWFVTDDSGEPLEDEYGDWIPATSDVRSEYVPHTHQDAPSPAPATPAEPPKKK